VKVTVDWRNVMLWGVSFGRKGPIRTVMICLGPITLFVDLPVKRVR
jgi:hypothetical protein